MELECGAPLTPLQWHWLQTTDVRLRRVRFHPDDAGSSNLLEDPSVLVSAPVIGIWQPTQAHAGSARPR